MRYKKQSEARPVISWFLRMLVLTAAAAFSVASGPRTALGVDPVPPLTFTTIAAETAGNEDGPATQARFALGYPSGVAGTWTKLGPDGGEIYSVAVDPSSPSTLWAGTKNGVFKSMDGGGHWTRMWASSTLAFGVAVHPSNGSIALVCDRNRQVYRTTDGGTSWVLSSGGLAPGNASSSSRIRFKPDDPTVVLYESGYIFRSTDTGATWVQSGTVSGTVLVFDPTSPSTVYAAGSLGVNKSTDAGISWAPANSGLPSRVSGAYTYFDIWSFALDPSNPQHLFAYRSQDSRVYASTDGGATWSVRSLAAQNLTSLVIPPGDGSVIYAGGSDSTGASPTYLGKFYKSTDSGATWASASGSIWSGYGAATVLAAGNVSPAIFGSIGGVLRKSTDAGATWTWASTNLRASEFAYLGFAASQPATWYLHGVSNGIQKTTDGGATVSSANGNLAYLANGTVVVDPKDPNNILAEGATADYFVNDGQNYDLLVRSTDGGGAWSRVANPTYPSTYYMLQIWGGVALPTTPTTFVLAAASGNEGVFKSTDGGATIRRTSNGLPTSSGLQYLDIAALDQNGTNLIVGTNVAAVFRSTDGGGTWSASSTGMAATANVPQLAASWQAPQRVFAATSSNGLYRSTDGGASWSLVPGLPFTSVMSVSLDPSNPSTVLVSGSTPSPWVSRSTDAGNTWAALPTAGLDLSLILRVAVDPANPNRILAAGFGGLSAVTLDPGDPLGKGVPAVVENNVPSLGGSGTGDGNGDGIQDSTQPNVASLPLLVSGGWVTIAGQNGTTLSGVQTIVNPSPADLPAGVSLPVGMVQFLVSGMGVGSCTTVTLYYPKNTSITNYYKYGPTPDNTTPHWYDFSYDGTTGAQIFQDATRTRIVLHLCDGLRGDGDIVKNGSIQDPGGPVVTLSCYTLSTGVISAGMGSVTVNTASNCTGGYVASTGVGVTANPLAGYAFTGWSGSGGTFSSSSSNPTTFTITGNATVTATFGALPGTPVVTGILPRVGPVSGGTPVTVTGIGFQPGATISIGGAAAGSVSFVSSTTLTATTPARPVGPADIAVTNPGGAASLVLPNGFLYTTSGGAPRFYTIVPCRILDTRNPNGPFGGPPLAAGSLRSLVIPSGSCPVPADAAAVVLNVTIADATDPGTLTIFPGSGPIPGTNTLSFVSGKNRANNVVLGLVGGVMTVKNFQSTGTVNLIVDVDGYFQ